MPFTLDWTVMPLAATLYVDSSNRIDARRTIDRTTTVRDGDGQPHMVHVTNLSASGCFVDTQLTLAVNQPIRIGIAGVGSIPAYIVRKQGLGYGCQFDTPLRARQVEQAFAESTVAQHPTARRTNGEEIDVGRWPGALRICVASGLAIGAWALVLALAL